MTAADRVVAAGTVLRVITIGAVDGVVVLGAVVVTAMVIQTVIVSAGDPNHAVAGRVIASHRLIVRTVVGHTTIVRAVVIRIFRIFGSFFFLVVLNLVEVITQGLLSHRLFAFVSNIKVQDDTGEAPRSVIRIRALARAGRRCSHRPPKYPTRVATRDVTHPNAAALSSLLHGLLQGLVRGLLPYPTIFRFNLCDRSKTASLSSPADKSWLNDIPP